MSTKASTSLTVHILGHEYQVNCPENERESLLQAAEYLNQRMGAIRKKGKSLGMERLAVMTALNMAHELLGSKTTGKTRSIDKDASHRLQQLQLRIDAALSEDR